jgi:serine/threonine protein phosphatase PrpC
MLEKIGIATLTNKNVNQDWSSKINNPKLQLYGVVVADGIGSYSHAMEAAKHVCTFVRKYIDDCEDLEKLDFDNIFSAAKLELIEYSREVGLDTEETALGTTLIVAVHYPTPGKNYDTIKLAYVGNGAIWHLRGNFNHFDKSQLLPWNAINYLNPHSVKQDGKEALYKLISCSSNFKESIPSVITIRADENFGDIIMVCTDGIYSFDQTKMGTDTAGRIWISGEQSMALFYSRLADFFKYGALELDHLLVDYLDNLNTIEELDDDATLGVFITAAAVNHQMKFNDAGSNNY